MHQTLEETKKSLLALPQLDHVSSLLLASWVTVILHLCRGNLWKDLLPAWFTSHLRPTVATAPSDTTREPAT